jgi:integrase
VPALGHHRLDRLQPERVEAFYRTMEQPGLSPSTVLKLHRVLSRALKVAVQRGKLTRNVCTLVDAPSLDRHEVVPLTADDARRILTAAEDDRNAARWSVALSLGLRQGEALGPRWDDVDLDAGTLTVRHALQRQKGAGLVLVPPKSRAGRRTIVLPAPLVDAMRRTVPRSSKNAWQRRTSGRTWGSYSRRRTAGRSTPAATGSAGWRYYGAPMYGPPDSTTPGTPRRRCCSSKACRRASRCRYSGTRRSA